MASSGGFDAPAWRCNVAEMPTTPPWNKFRASKRSNCCTVLPAGKPACVPEKVSLSTTSR